MSESQEWPSGNDSLEDLIFQRINQWQEQYPNSDGPRDPELEGLIYQFLYRELRGVAAVLPGLGPQANQANADFSCRFTSVLNKAFLRIIERYPDRLMRSKSREQLTGYVSRTMSNMMLNHYKRKGTFRKVMETLGLTEQEDAHVRDILSHLSEEKGSYFERRTGVPFANGLEVIHSWDKSADPDLNSLSAVLRLRYVDGLGYDEIGSEMQVDRETVERLLERAKYQLRKLKP